MLIFAKRLRQKRGMESAAVQKPPPSSPAPSNRSNKSDSPSSRGSGKKKGHSLRKKKSDKERKEEKEVIAADAGGAPAAEGDDGISEEAAKLLAESMSSFRITPRNEEASAESKSKIMGPPLPDTIRAPAIVLQHSMKAIRTGPPELNKYDYLRPEEMAAVWANGSDDILRTPLTDRKGGHDITIENWEQRSKAVAKLMIENEKAEEEAKERVASFRAALTKRVGG